MEFTVLNSEKRFPQNEYFASVRGLARIQAALVAIVGTLALASYASAQRAGTKPTRAEAPVFSRSDSAGIFFEDVKSLLKGELPSTRRISNTPEPTMKAESGGSSADDPRAWKNLITPNSLEDLVKGSKLELDKIVTTPAAFMGGGFKAARREFSLQAVLFSIIEEYPGEVRWKNNSAVARELLTRAASNTKVGSIQTYNESKKRLLDLGDLVNGASLAGEARTEIAWGEAIDRTPLMELLKWAFDEHVAKYCASESEFQSNKDSLRKYAELISVLGKIAIHEDMPDGSDADYVAFANEMIARSHDIALAVEANNADQARSAAAKVGQSCTDCHESYR